MRYRLMNWYQRLRIAKYRLFSTCQHVEGRPTIRQPVQFVGRGTIKFHGTANLGWFPSPFYLNGYIYLEARTETSRIEIGDAVAINNNTFLVSDGPGIFIGNRTLLGANCEILDSDGHEIHPDRRTGGVPKTGKVVIEENVLIGSNVRILRGVRIGKNSVIANGAVVTRSFPENMLIFGNPAKAGFAVQMDEPAPASNVS